MFSNRQTILVVFITISCLFACTRARSVSVIGDVHVDVSEAKFICDKIECPIPATHRCVITKEKDQINAAVLIRKNTCYSLANEVLKNSVTTEAIDPSANINFHIEANRHGMISSVGNSYGSVGFDVQQFNREMSSFQRNLQEELNNLNRELSNLGVEFSNILG